MPPELTPAPTPAANPFSQHPDSLIKKSTRNAAPAEPAAAPAIDPAAKAAEDAAFEEVKAKLPSLLWGDKPKAAAPAAAVSPPPAKPAEPVAPAAPAAPAAPKVTVTRTPSAAEIAKATAAEVTRQIAENQRQQAAPTPPAAPAAPVDGPPAHFSEEDKENYALFKVLSETEPGKHKDKHLAYSQFVDKFNSYKRKWEKDHAGDTFDKDSDDHEDFYSKNQPDYTPADLDKARIRLETSREVARQVDVQKKDYEAKLRDIEDRTVGAEVSREAAKVADTATGAFISQLQDDGLKTALAKGAAALKESDPLAFEVLNTEAASLQRNVVELHNIVNRRGYYDHANPVHAGISAFVAGQEQAIQQLPLAQQVFEGKQFVTRAQFATMPPEQRARHWALTEPDVIHMLSASSAAKAAKILHSERERFKTLAPKYGFVPGAAAPATPAPTAAAAAAPAGVAKPNAPSGSAGAAAAPAGTGTNAPAPPVENQLVKSLF